MVKATFCKGQLSNNAVLADAVCCFGVFDGVHVGHRFLIQQMLDDAARSGKRAVIITFDTDPDELFAKPGFMKLMSNEARIEALAGFGAEVLVLPFSRAFAAVAPDNFLYQCFGAYTPATMHVGDNFNYGYKAQGNAEALQEWGSAHGMHVVAHNLEKLAGTAVSSTRIRSLLAQSGANLEEANRLLGHAYRMGGRVEPGRAQGRDMGFRTANVYVQPDLRALAPGVFAAYAHVGERPYKAAVSVGVSPMFADETQAYCEAHLLDFEGNLYGARIDIDFVSYLRPMMRFESVQALIDTVMGNIDWVRTNL